MKSLAILTGCLLMAVAGAGPALAQALADVAPWAKPYAGRWTLSGNSEGDPVCGLNLGTATAIGGAQVEISATCRRNYPFEDVAGWRLDGRSIVMIDALRKPLFRFAPAPDGSWMTILPGEKSVSLERGAPQRPRNLRELFEEGTFTLSGPDNAGACGFAVTVKSATGGPLEQGGRCPPRWKGKGWSSWSAAGDTLQLKDRKGGVILELIRADEFTFVSQASGGPWFFGPGVIDGSEVFDR